MRPTPAILRQILPDFDGTEEIGSVGGGCISEAFSVALSNGSKYFVKANDVSFLPNFAAESDGLAALREAAEGIDEVMVPIPHGVSQTEEASWLLMQWIEPQNIHAAFFANFGCGMAKLHRATLQHDDATRSIGWRRDNYLGAAPQINTWSNSWIDFFAEHRLGYQLRWAKDQGYLGSRVQRNLERIINDLPVLLDGREPSTSLVHGDLWSGNYLCSQSTAVLIDPAVYRGCREAEFGMLKLFGACPNEFYEAYEAEFPMPGGCWRRVKVYLLYHLLNHLNLFGGGYLAQCEAAAEEILRESNT